MSNDSATNLDARLLDRQRAETLTAIGTKWNKLSKQEVSELKTKDELVTLVVAKYGVDKTAAQREVDGLMAGRSFTA